MYYKIILTTEYIEILDLLKKYYSKFLYGDFLRNFDTFIGLNILKLNILPHRCKIFNEKLGIRVLIIEGKYKIFYKINEMKKEVYILKIFLISQNDENFF